MAANTSPLFYLTPHNEAPHTDGDGGAAGALKTQNTNLDGTGTLLTVFTATVSGSGMDLLAIHPGGTNIATVMRFFFFDGSNTNLVDEMTLPATTASATAAMQPFYWAPPARLSKMASGQKWKVTVGTTVAAGYWLTSFGGDF